MGTLGIFSELYVSFSWVWVFFNPFWFRDWEGGVFLLFFLGGLVEGVVCGFGVVGGGFVCGVMGFVGGLVLGGGVWGSWRVGVGVGVVWCEEAGLRGVGV